MKFSTPESEYLVALLKTAINESEVPPPPEQINWNKLVELSKTQQVYSTILPVIKKINIPTEQAQELTFYSQNELVRMLAMKNELEEIEKELEKRQIKYMLLKGSVIKNYYPLQKMRQMSDFDILYDVSKRDALIELMLERGYAMTSDGEHSDDFFKKPFYTFEWHRQLFFNERAFTPDFGNVWENAVSDDKYKYKYNMNPNDLYLHTVAHMYKHYIMGGFGVRFFVDIYVLLKGLDTQLDYEYISAKLQRMKLAEFEFKVRSISKALFGDGELTDELIVFVNETLSFGIYGNGNSKECRARIYYDEYASKHNDASVFKYYASKLFPNKIYMKRTYPVLNKRPYLIGWYYIVRLCDRFFHSRRRIMRDIKQLNSNLKEDKKN